MANEMKTIMHIAFPTAEEATKAVERITTDGRLDFNRITPMPESLKVVSSYVDNTAVLYAAFTNHWRYGEMPEKAQRMYDYALNRIGPSTHTAMVNILGKYPESGESSEAAKKAVLKDYNTPTSREQLLALGEILVDNINQYGEPTWYEWAKENWGTKRNIEDGGEVVWNGTNEVGFEFSTAYDEPRPIIKKVSEMFPDATVEAMYATEFIGQGVGCVTLKAGEFVGGVVGYVEDYEEAVKMACDVWGYDPDDLLNPDGVAEVDE